MTPFDILLQAATVSRVIFAMCLFHKTQILSVMTMFVIPVLIIVSLSQHLMLILVLKIFYWTTVLRRQNFLVLQPIGLIRKMNVMKLKKHITVSTLGTIRTRLDAKGEQAENVEEQTAPESFFFSAPNKRNIIDECNNDLLEELQAVQVFSGLTDIKMEVFNDTVTYGFLEECKSSKCYSHQKNVSSSILLSLGLNVDKTVHECQWEGITCRDHSVTSLILPGKQRKLVIQACLSVFGPLHLNVLL